MGVTKSGMNDPVIVVRQDRGVWLAMGVDGSNFVFGAFPVFYNDNKCAGNAFAYAEAVPAPLFRALQKMMPTDTTAFYAGNPVVSQAFPYMLTTSDPNNPGVPSCVTTVSQGWDAALPVGPLQTVDLTQFPGPFSLK
jgi:hypothetical protein